MKLFIDTHSSYLTLGLVNENKLIDEVNLLCKNSHSETAIVAIQSLLGINNVPQKAISEIYVVVGPGSFTGVRIAVTIAKTYAWALGIPVRPISSLKMMALSYRDFDYYVSLIDARRGYVYGAIYDSDYNEALKEQYITLENLLLNVSKLKGKTVFLSNDKFDILSVTTPTLDIKKIVEYYSSAKKADVHNLNPVYLKKTEAEESLEK